MKIHELEITDLRGIAMVTTKPNGSNLVIWDLWVRQERSCRRHPTSCFRVVWPAWKVKAQLRSLH